ncbi:hypothetical protein GCM10027594_25990 [Hymenobacter agri]
MKTRLTRCCLLALLSLAACKKEYPNGPGLSYSKGYAYYHFTTDDQPWLQAQEGEEWVLESPRGGRRVYRVEQARLKLQAEKRTAPGLLTSGVLLNYYDYFDLRTTRIDTPFIKGEIRFYRDAALTNANGTNLNKSQFYATGVWQDFVGNADTATCNFQGMRFPTGAGLNGPFQRLTVRGRTYTEVVAFVGTPLRAGCARLHPSTIEGLYYDRQAGLVRMVSLAGEVWERVL